jgi:hypothetical protein
MHVVGKYDPGIDAEGCPQARPADCLTQHIDMPHQQVGAAVEQVHRKEEGSARNPIAAIFRHEPNMPDLGDRRNALRFSALRLLSR